MARPAGTSAKAERDQLRDRMCPLGCPLAQIAAEMGRQFDLRLRLSWRHALGWTQCHLAQRYNTAHPGARLSANRVSQYETWPHRGSSPGLRYLSGLATTYGHGCTPFQLVDLDELEHINPGNRRLLIASGNGYAPAALSCGSPRQQTPLSTLAIASGARLMVPDASGWAATHQHRPRPLSDGATAVVATVTGHRAASISDNLRLNRTIRIFST
jgi:hypothetical protein